MWLFGHNWFAVIGLRLLLELSGVGVTFEIGGGEIQSGGYGPSGWSIPGGGIAVQQAPVWLSLG